MSDLTDEEIRMYLARTFGGGRHVGNELVHDAIRSKLDGVDVDLTDRHSAQIEATAKSLEDKGEEKHASVLRTLLGGGTSKKSKK